MGILLSAIATVGIVAQHLIDYIIKSRAKKKVVGLIILALTGLVVWGSYAIRQHDANEVLENLVTIQQQNDSLKLQLTIIKQSQEELQSISERAMLEVSRERKTIGKLKDSKLSRSIPDDKKADIITMLSNQLHPNIGITCVLGDNESYQFGYAWKEIFVEAGWEVAGVDQAIFAAPVNGIVIKVQSRQYPQRVNAILRVFAMIDIQVDGVLDKNMKPNAVELIVGSQ